MVTLEAKETANGIIPKMDIDLQCGDCGMPVDAREYTQEECSDCKKPWNPVQHVTVYATTVPASGQVF